MASITEFNPPTDKTEALLSYPFAAPEGSYLTTGSELHAMPGKFGDFHDAVNQELEIAKLPLLEERIPVIAYGSNANPVRFAEKMEPFATGETHEQLQITPFQEAEVTGGVVWHGKQGQSGSVFAELYDGPLVAEGTTTNCKVSWVTKEQLAVLHTTEGVTYHLAEIEARAGSDEKPIKAYAYVAGRSSILLKGGKAIPVARPGIEQAHDSMTAREAVAFMLGRIADVQAVGLPQATTPEGLVAEMTSQKTLADKKALQTAVQRALTSKGASQGFSYPAPYGARIGRADFNFLDDYHTLHLLEESVASIRKPDAAKNIVAAVRRRAHNELAEHLETDALAIPKSRLFD